MLSHRRSRPMSSTNRIRHRRLRIELLEDRRVLAGGLAPELPGLYLVDPDVDKLRGQIIYLDYDGEENVTYNGPVTIGPFDVPAFETSGELVGQEEQIIADVLDRLDATFADTGLTFVTEAPAPATPHSTIYIGGTDAPFAEHGSFLGLAEKVDVGNQDPADEAFVFAEGFSYPGATLDLPIGLLHEVIAHETGRLLGYANQEEVGINASPLAHVAATGSKSGSHWGDAPYTEAGFSNRASLGIDISGAPANAVVTSITVGWNVDANWLVDNRWFVEKGGWRSSEYSTPHTGDDSPGFGYDQTSDSERTVSISSSLGVSPNGTWWFNVYDSYNDSGTYYDKGQIDYWDITVNYTYTPPAPDLEVTDIDALSEPWEWGDSVSVDMAVKNEGTATAVDTTIKLIASNDTTVGDSDDHEIAVWDGWWAQDIDQGETWSDTYSFTLPSSPWSYFNQDDTIYVYLQTFTDDPSYSYDAEYDSVSVSPPPPPVDLVGADVVVLDDPDGDGYPYKLDVKFSAKADYGSRSVYAKLKLDSGTTVDTSDDFTIDSSTRWFAPFDDTPELSRGSYDLNIYVYDASTDESLDSIGEWTHAALDNVKMEKASQEITTPPPPTNVRISHTATEDTGSSQTDAITNNSAPLFEWTAPIVPSGIHEYEYEYWEGTTYKGIWETNSSNPSWSASWGFSDSVHSIRFRAIEATESVIGDWSAWYDFTIDTASPDRPENLTNPADTTTDSTPNVTWSAPSGTGSGIWKYEVHWDGPDFGYGNDFELLTSTNTTLDDSEYNGNSLTPGWWEWWVRAYDVAGNVSGWEPIWATDGKDIEIVDSEVTAIRWENAAGQELADGAHVMPGASVFIEVDTIGMRGTNATVYLFEDDGIWDFDEFIKSITVPIPIGNDTGRIEWQAEWHADSDWAADLNPLKDIAPEYRLWESTGIIGGDHSRLLELSAPTLRWETAGGSLLTGTVDEGSIVYLSVDGLGFETSEDFTATIHESDWAFLPDDFIATGIPLTYDSANKWRGAWEPYWTSDNLSELHDLFTDLPEYYFSLDDFSLDSGTIDVRPLESLGERVVTHTKGDGIPLILIHGNGSDKRSSDFYRWQTFLEYIESNTSMFAEFDVYVWRRSSSLPIGFKASENSQADLLAQFIYDDLGVGIPGTPYATTGAILVAHSQGGLVARSFMNEYNASLGHFQGDDILGLITLATPHHGSPFAVPDWDAQMWEDMYGGSLGDWLNFRALVGPGALGFNSNRAGDANLAWDNLDNALVSGDTTTFWAPLPVVYDLTLRDSNSIATSSDSTEFYPDELKADYGTLADLNRREQYAGKIVTFGAYDDSLADNMVGATALGYLGTIYQDIGLAVLGDHGGLNVITAMLAEMELESSGNFFANDGMVPLQSALFLDISAGNAFASKSLLGEVTLDSGAIEAAGQVLRQYVLRGDTDGIRDHLDLLDTANQEYWNTVRDEIRSFLPGDPEIEVQLVVTDPAAAEPSSNGTFRITRTGGSTASALTVNFNAPSGSAIRGTDYDLMHGWGILTGNSVTIGAGQSYVDVPVYVRDDDIDEDSEPVILTLASGSGYTLGGTTSGTVTISDDDTAGVTVDPTGGLITTEAGGTATFTIRLNSEPTTNVTIALSSSDTSEGTVAPTNLTFTPSNWAQAQTVTVTGQQDTQTDGNVGYTIVTAAASSTDPKYSGRTVEDVSITNVDDEEQGLVLSTTNLPTVPEGGSSTFTVKLAKQPTDNVTVEIARTSGDTDLTASPSSLAFTTSNWNSPQTVTVSAAQDPDATNGQAVFTVSSNGLTSLSVTATEQDDESTPAADEGWSNRHGDLTGTNYYPYGSEVQTSNSLQLELTIGTTDAISLTGDVDGDEELELVRVEGNKLSIYDENGQLQTQQTLPTAGTLSMLGDVDGDGVLDIGIGGKVGNATTAYCYFYDGDGVLLQTFERSVGYDGAIYPTAVASPGKVLVWGAAGYSRNPRGLFLYDYNTGNEDWTYGLGFPSGHTSTADIDGDEKLESSVGWATVHNGHVVNDTTDGELYLTITDDDGTNLLTQKYPSPDNGSARHIFSDLNQDGTYEILAIEQHDPTYYRGANEVHLYDLAGNMLHTYTGPTDENWLWATADIDNDANQNVVVGGYSVLTVLDHQLQEVRSISEDGFVQLVADLTGNGYCEIVTINSSNLLRVYDYKLDLLDSTQLSGDARTNGGAIASDIDADGIVELVVRSSAGSHVVSFERVVAGVRITESGDSTNVVEGGATDAYEVVLVSAPTADVTITIAGDGQVTAVPTTLTFTTTNWNHSQTVTVTAVNDDVDEDSPHTGTIMHTASSTDERYNGIDINDVTANITDDDTPDTTLVNVALASQGATATASSTGSYMGITKWPHLAIDGDSTTHWANNGSMPAWLQVEFDKEYDIDQVGVSWGPHQHTFSISLSMDGQEWTEVVASRLAIQEPHYVNGEHVGGDYAHELFVIPVTRAKFIRVDITTTTAPGSHIFQAMVGELEAYAASSNVRLDIAGRSSVDGTWWVGESTGSQFASSEWGGWPAIVDWHDVVVGDFTGDGQEEIAGRKDGAWWVARSTPGGVVTEQWGRWSTTVVWEDVLVGDFNGDGRADIAGRANGYWWIARSNGSGFVNERWERWSANIDWDHVAVGDFDNNGLDDIVGRARSSGDWVVAKSTDGQFVSEVWGRWSPAVTWVNVLVGDFTGDGRDDLVGRNAANGDWYVARSTGSAFVTGTTWGKWSAAQVWLDVQVADMNGDGTDDVIGRLASTGDWYVNRSLGDRFNVEKWGNWAQTTTWTDVLVADVNGDGRDDIAGRNADGDWVVARSTGTGLINEVWGQWAVEVPWVDVLVADLDGDGKQDLIGRGAGIWQAARSTGTSFASEIWCEWPHVIDWQDVHVADVDGDGLDDIVGRNDGVWWVARSTGSGFVNEQWGRWSTLVVWEDVVVGDFDGDGRTDIAGRANGYWWIARSTGSSFVNERWERWSASIDWEDVAVGDFDGDGRDDLVGRARSSGDWVVAKSTGSGFVSEVWGRWSPTLIWVNVHVGDVTGDGLHDLVGRNAANGDWYVARSTGSALVTGPNWGKWSASQTWLDVQVVDANGDGQDDVIGRLALTGDWYVNRSLGDGFVAEPWGRWTTGTNWSDVHAADVDGDGRADLVGRNTSGNWTVARSIGEGFTNEAWGNWSAGVVWQDVLIGNFSDRVPDAMHAAGLPSADHGPVAELTDADLQWIVDSAVPRLAEMTGSDDVSHLLESVTFQIADLPGALLGQALGTTILIDRNAAGFGWFVDRTPWVDEEYSGFSATRGLLAVAGSPADQRMDLLTVVLHELGHALGYDHTDTGLMQPTQAPGVRCLWENLLWGGLMDDGEGEAVVDDFFATI